MFLLEIQSFLRIFQTYYLIYPYIQIILNLLNIIINFSCLSRGTVRYYLSVWDDAPGKCMFFLAVIDGVDFTQIYQCFPGSSRENIAGQGLASQ